MKNFKLKFVLFVILVIFWVLWNNTLKPDVLIAGFIIIFITVLIFGKSVEIFRGIKFTPTAFLNTLLYVIVFFVEMIKSNLDVLGRVLNPKLPIKPGIVRVETKLKSPMARLILANSITLTPGTFVVDIKDQYLYVHWIEVCCSAKNPENQEKITQQIAGKFENILMKIYE